ncbi:MAG TPA: hypothetical protein VEY95_09215 [Azospirillaceae bacterium]|nr:hypothetical protein [Azospirillaceae bacterium]
MRASIFHIELALAGKIDFVRKTNPYGSADDDPADAPPDAQADRAKVAVDVKSTLRSMMKRQSDG